MTFDRILVPLILVSLLPATAFATNVGINGGPCTFDTIEEAAANAGPGAILRVKPGPYLIDPIVVTQDLQIWSSNSTCSSLTSGQVTILPAGSERLFDVNGAELELVGLTVGGRTNFESLIFAANGAAIIAIDSTIQDGDSDTDGGCVTLVDSSFATLDVEMSDCHAAQNGGGIYAVNSEVFIHDSTLERNEALDGHGGGIYLEFSDLVVDLDSTLASNSASDFGGAVYLEDSEGSILATELRSNDALSGGAIYARSNNSTPLLTIGPDVRIAFNHAEENGGGVRGFDTGMTFTGDVEITDNDAGLGGGGLSMTDVELEMTASESDAIALSRNEAPDGAGMLVALNAETRVELTGVLFSDNVASDDGGGLMASDGADVTLFNTRFVSNTAVRGSGIFVAVESVLVMDADFNECSVAGLAKDTYCSELVSNNATNNGTILVRDASTVEIKQTAFRSNTAGNDGGAVRLVDQLSGVTMRNTLVIDDQSAVGAAVKAVDGTLNIYSSTFADNGAPVEYAAAAAGEFARNIVWRNTSDLIPGVATGNCNITQTVAGKPAGTKNVTSDPRFDAADPRSAYRLQNGSPAIDACSTATPQDIDGTVRFLGLTYDRGAFEDQ